MTCLRGTRPPAAAAGRWIRGKYINGGAKVRMGGGRSRGE